MKVRIVSNGWETFTGSLGFQAVFKDGVSVDDLNPRQIARIGSSLAIVDVETGEQVGPSVVAQKLSSAMAPVIEALPMQEEVEQEQRDERARLLAEAEERKEAEKAALAEAQAKAQEDADEITIYSRIELEAIGANNGINALREIAAPLGVKGRSISELVKEILQAQADKAIV